MNVHLVTYATGRYERGRTRLVCSAEKFGVSRCWNYSPKEFKKTIAYKSHKDVSRVYRGAGLWLWKPYYILHVLDKLEENDYLVYLDAGIEIISSLDPLLNLCQDNQGVALFKAHEHMNGLWTKRDCFVLMDCDIPLFHEQEQNMGGIIVLKKSQFVIDFIQEWFDYCCDINVISDNESRCGLPNLNGFIEHRHDQSILTNLRIKYGLEAFTDPSQFGNKYRIESRKGQDDYSEILNLHRERLPSWRKALQLLMSDRTKFIQGFRIHIRRLLSKKS